MKKYGTGRWGPGRRQLLTALTITTTLLAALAWMPAPASAVASPRMEEGGSGSNSNNFKNATARCTGDQQVYGAAFRIVDGDGKVAINTLQPGADLRTVFVEASEIGPGLSTDWEIFAQAICGPPTANLRLVPASEVEIPARSKNVRARCSVTEKIYGGGFTFANGHGEAFLTHLEYVNPREVNVAATVDDNVTLNWGITAYAICGTPAATHIFRDGADVVVNSDTPKTQRVACPPGTRVHGVGVRMSSATGDLVIDDLNVTLALQNLLAKAYENDATTVNWSVRPQVICAS